MVFGIGDLVTVCQDDASLLMHRRSLRVIVAMID
jgi:hypothetical protein